MRRSLGPLTAAAAREDQVAQELAARGKSHGLRGHRLEFPRKGHRAAETRQYLCGLRYARRVLRILAGRTEFSPRPASQVRRLWPPTRTAIHSRPIPVEWTGPE